MGSFISFLDKSRLKCQFSKEFPTWLGSRKPVLGGETSTYPKFQPYSWLVKTRLASTLIASSNSGDSDQIGSSSGSKRHAGNSDDELPFLSKLLSSHNGAGHIGHFLDADHVWDVH